MRRYTLRVRRMNIGGDCAGMEPWESGEWVSHSDAQSEVERLRSLLREAATFLDVHEASPAELELVERIYQAAP